MAHARWKLCFMGVLLQWVVLQRPVGFSGPVAGGRGENRSRRRAISVSSLQESLPESHEVGDAVQAVYDGVSRPGIIHAANADGSYAVRWLGQLDAATSDVESQEIERVSGRFAVGDAVQVDDQRGKLVAKEADSFTICWENGSESEISAFEAQPVLIPFEHLEVGQRYRATVHRVYHSGAFVDFGAEVMGNLPTAYVLTKDGSRIGKFDPITEHLKRNQKIQVVIQAKRLDRSVRVAMVNDEELTDENWDGALLHTKGPMTQEEKEPIVELFCSKLRARGFHRPPEEVLA